MLSFLPPKKEAFYKQTQRNAEWSESLYLKANLILKQQCHFQPNFMKISLTLD